MGRRVSSVDAVELKLTAAVELMEKTCNSSRPEDPFSQPQWGMSGAHAVFFIGLRNMYKVRSYELVEVPIIVVVDSSYGLSCVVDFIACAFDPWSGRTRFHPLLSLLGRCTCFKLRTRYIFWHRALHLH